MGINRKVITTVGLSGIIALVALTSMAPDNPEYMNLKVLPKSITQEQLGKVMETWSHSLGVHCNFCHVRNDSTKKMDFPSDAKPEKEMARHMFKMMNKINKKYFDFKNDSLLVAISTGIDCYTCHRGNSHPEVKLPEMKRGPGGPGNGPGGPDKGPGGSGGPGGNKQ
jgi:hypothetical protein